MGRQGLVKPCRPQLCCIAKRLPDVALKTSVAVSLIAKQSDTHLTSHVVSEASYFLKVSKDSF